MVNLKLFSGKIFLPWCLGTRQAEPGVAPDCICGHRVLGWPALVASNFVHGQRLIMFCFGSSVRITVA
jgi:hypothetical protein